MNYARFVLIPQKNEPKTLPLPKIRVALHGNFNQFTYPYIVYSSAQEEPYLKKSQTFQSASIVALFKDLSDYAGT